MAKNGIHTGGHNGGRPKKRPGAPLDEHTDKRTYKAEELAQAAATRIITGKLPRNLPSGPLSGDDARLMQRISGMSVEAFNEMVATDLREVSALALQSIKEALAARAFKPGELGFLYSVSQDKRLSLDGSRALNSASVNIQVNNYGTAPKETLLAELDGMTYTRPSPPPILPVEPSDSPPTTPPKQPDTDTDTLSIP